MLATPELNFRRAPVTLILAAVSLAIEAVCFLDPERRLYYQADLRLAIWWQIWTGAIWQPLTTTVLHGDLLHVIFNVYWLCTFGGVIENWLGSFRTLALIVLLAYVSSLAEYVGGYYLLREVHTGVGLSGVVYGLFGLLWVGGRYRQEFLAACTPQTAQLMIVWFFFCILTTWLKWMAVANLAHGAGLALGVLLGLAIFQIRRRWLWTALAAAFSLIALATMIAAPGHEHYEWVKANRARTAPP